MRALALRRFYLLCAILVGAFGADTADAQQVAADAPVLLGTEAEERLRLSQLHDTAASSSSMLLRAMSRVGRTTADTNAWRVRPLTPALMVVANSALPLSLNDGPLHAGRGVNAMVTAGMELRYGRLRAVLAPQLVLEQNLPYQVIQFPQSPALPRSIWANPFHPLPESIDLPLRFGDLPHRRVDPGQSSVMLEAGRTEIGVATENVWWGPGIRNALILSNNAAGFPHLVARTREPLVTRLGAFEFDALAGRLSESDYFDADPSNDRRTVVAGAVTWHPVTARPIWVGLSRLRIAGTSGHDQMSSLFGRWILPASGAELYAEWARFEDPTSLRDFLEYPNHAEGYTLGLQWARPVSAGRSFRFQAEVSYVEPSASIRLRPVMTSYTSATVQQGFTQRGEVLGAAIGPGSSSQWLAGDLFAAAWRLGAFAGRTRYDNGTLYEPIVPGFKLQDVSLFAGVRAATAFRGAHVALELTDTARLNYLYQAYIADPIATTSGGVDISNRTLSLIVSSAPRR